MVLQAFVATLLPSQDGSGLWGEYFAVACAVH